MVRSLNHQLKNLLTEITLRGTQSSPRGLAVKEIELTTLALDSTFSVADSTARPFNWSYLCGEMAWYLQRDNHIGFIDHFSKFWQNIATPEGYVNSNYGTILFGIQMEWAKEALLKDKNTRQAVCFVNSPRYQYDGNKDFVCTMYIIFWIRDNRLNMKVQMRSNDVFYGLSYDAPFFAFVQQTMWLWIKEKYTDLELGTYYHSADNSHFYEKHFEVAEKIMQEDPRDPVYFLLKEPLFNVKDGQFILLPPGQECIQDANEVVRNFIENPEYKILNVTTKQILQKYFCIQ